MIKNSVFVITAVIMFVIIVVQAVILINPPIGGHEVTAPENAIIIAKAALLQKYGEEELQKVQNGFAARISIDYPAYWVVQVDKAMLGYPPRIYVRQSDGKAIVRWRTNWFSHWGPLF